MSTAEIVRAAALTAFQTVSGIAKFYSADPWTVPGELPALSMVYMGPSPVDNETGPRVDMTHEWAVYLYLDKTADPASPQVKLEQLLGPLVQAIAVDPTLGYTCDRSRLDARRFRPDFSKDGYVLKEMRLLAELSE